MDDGARMLRDGELLQVSLRLLKATGIWSAGKAYDLITIAEGHRSIEPDPNHHTIIVIGRGAEVTLNARTRGELTIIVEEDAKLRYASTGEGDIRTFIYLKAGAQLIWNDASIVPTDATSTVYLADSGAGARYGSVMLGNDADCAQQITMVHAASHTSSYMLTRAVLTGNGKGRYRGTIKVAETAKGCDAHQKAEALLLGDDSRIDAVPILEISNEEVKCSHGVAIGQVDEEQLYYLQSRGIDRELAIKMIIHGFFDQMLIAMGDAGDRLRKSLEAAI